ncbi:kelch repeat protein [Leptospira broomii serovar Hurstbridge str. 5399]|uniref:Kelch repeat protein n=1 Tax=Leptospira broomii serovar Hurstbridge str. 5399 TaxID=1049789 RepID=T0F4Q6_9LEPT|nr:kelch repeat-containing protein [Leptospira broomii]EQA46065.1 kelch repeat protein [Leptospira broomii serovar Hurstbridge str. 5399]
MKVRIYLLIFISIFLFASCQGSPITNGQETSGLKIQAFGPTSITSTTATITWSCSTEVQGIIGYGISGPTNFIFGLVPSKLQSITLTNLQSNTQYSYSVFCGELSPKAMGTSIFTTLPSNQNILNRSIWIVGGIGNGNTPVAQVDMYDPVAGQWYNAITTLPTPRAFAGVVSYNGKIYVMGGVAKIAGVFTAVNTVEVYDPIAGTWTTLAPIPSSLQGMVAGTVGTNIYLIAGTTTTDMTTGTILNTVYKFYPDVSTTGVWQSYTSNTNIFARVDMAGCAVSGTLFFTGGRLYTDGSVLSSTDGYAPSSNSTTAFNEPALSGTGSYGAASACYRPLPTDPHPTDPPALLVAGGSNSQVTPQPVTALNSLQRYDYYPVGSATFQTGPVLPTTTAFAAMEISYDLRKAYIFGGESSLNIPTSLVYWIDLTNPIGGPWTAISASMPVARFGHRAVIISR